MVLYCRYVSFRTCRPRLFAVTVGLVPSSFPRGSRLNNVLKRHAAQRVCCSGAACDLPAITFSTAFRNSREQSCRPASSVSARLFHGLPWPRAHRIRPNGVRRHSAYFITKTRVSLRILPLSLDHSLSFHVALHIKSDLHNAGYHYKA